MSYVEAAGGICHPKTAEAWAKQARLTKRDRLQNLGTENLANGTGSERRHAAFKRVEGYVCKDQQNTYGDAKDNFADIAAVLNVILAAKLKAMLQAHDIASIMAAVKLVRMKTSLDHQENWDEPVDYAVCAGGIVAKSNEDKETPVAQPGEPSTE
jgi:hypothetical protein